MVDWEGRMNSKTFWEVQQVLKWFVPLLTMLWLFSHMCKTQWCFLLNTLLLHRTKLSWDLNLSSLVKMFNLAWEERRFRRIKITVEATGSSGTTSLLSLLRIYSWCSPFGAIGPGSPYMEEKRFRMWPRKTLSFNVAAFYKHNASYSQSSLIMYSIRMDLIIHRE